VKTIRYLALALYVFTVLLLCGWAFSTVTPDAGPSLPRRTQP
jgi:hypothetical protein